MIDATLNCLAVLIRSRPAIANKILQAVLNFNPLNHASASMTPRLTVIFKSMERTTRALLRYVMRYMPNNPLEQKIQAYLLRLQQSRTAFFSDSPSLKRQADPTDGIDDAKRQKVTGGQRKFPPLPPPPNTVAQLFTLTEDPAIQQFDVKYLPLELIDFTVPLLLKSIAQEHLDEAIGAIRSRLSHLSKASQRTPVPDVPMDGPTGIDDEDEYDPEFELSTDVTTNAADKSLIQPGIDLGPFELPKPPPLTGTELSIVSEQSVDHLESLIRTIETQPTPARQKLGLNRLAASANDRDAWTTILIRVATRTPAALDEYEAAHAIDSDEEDAVKPDPDSEPPTIANRIRQRLFMYIVDDFRARLNVAISWLCEEWYVDKVASSSNPGIASRTPNYDRHSLRLLSSLLPYFDARDKNHLIRFLSEIPAINPALLQACAQQLARDPERIGMFVLSMQYLLMFRPPVREIVLDVLEQVWEEGDSQVRGVTAKVLSKWRPAALEGLKREDGMKVDGDARSPVLVEGRAKGE